MKQKLSRMLGFTMIELLVVIAVIGILAVAVLSAINPIEQINKGRDTRTRSDAAELLGAVERYYTTQESYPWNLAITAAPAWVAVASDVDAIFGDADDEFNWVQTLSSSSEIKAQFGQRLLSAYSTAATVPEFVLMKEADAGAVSPPVYVCFLPTSNQFKIEATKKCCAAITGGGVCPAAGASVNTAPATLGTFVPCASTDGDTTVDNYICLP